MPVPPAARGGGPRDGELSAKTDKLREIEDMDRAARAGAVASAPPQAARRRRKNRPGGDGARRHPQGRAAWRRVHAGRPRRRGQQLRELSGGGPGWLSAAQGYLSQNPGALAGPLGTAAFFRREVKEGVAAVGEPQGRGQGLAAKLEAVVAKIHTSPSWACPAPSSWAWAWCTPCTPTSCAARASPRGAGGCLAQTTQTSMAIYVAFIHVMKRAMGTEVSMLLLAAPVLANAATDWPRPAPPARWQAPCPAR